VLTCVGVYWPEVPIVARLAVMLEYNVTTAVDN
jgi:hypothetical protein